MVLNAARRDQPSAIFAQDATYVGVQRVDPGGIEKRTAISRGEHNMYEERSVRAGHGDARGGRACAHRVDGRRFAA